MSSVAVNVDNFPRAETDRMFAAVQAQAGVNQWLHYRAPTPIDRQTVIRMNRDTLYSAAVVDISAGARLTRTGRSPSVSAAAGTAGQTACRSWTAGTTPSASTGPAPRSSTAAGPSRPSHRVPEPGSVTRSATAWRCPACPGSPRRWPAATPCASRPACTGPGGTPARGCGNSGRPGPDRRRRAGRVLVMRAPGTPSRHLRQTSSYPVVFTQLLKVKKKEIGLSYRRVISPSLS